MTAFLALRALVQDLSCAVDNDAVCHSLVRIAEGFGLSRVMVAIPATGADGPLAVTFCSFAEASDLSRLPNELWRHALVTRARSSDRPFLIEDVRVESHLNETEWAIGLPVGCQDMIGMVVPVHEGNQLATWVYFAGDAPLLSQRTICVISAATYAAMARSASSKSKTPLTATLTLRETECLRLVAQGMNDPEIGKALGISERTVRFHISNVKLKLRVRSRAQAVAQFLGHPEYESRSVTEGQG